MSKKIKRKSHKRQLSNGKVITVKGHMMTINGKPFNMADELAKCRNQLLNNSKKTTNMKDSLNKKISDLYK